MKTLIAVLFGLSMGTGIALAQTAFTDLDADGDGLLSMEEAMANPAITEDVFKAADVDQDEALSEEEYSAVETDG